jgi:hypothetical protein
MKAFITACLAAIVIAAIGIIVLDRIQQPVDEAFTSPFAKLGT